MQVPVVTQVPLCIMQTTSLRSSSCMTIAQTLVPAFQSRSGLALQSASVVASVSLQTPLVVQP